jgi:hypothetical protein
VLESRLLHQFMPSKLPGIGVVIPQFSQTGAPKVRGYTSPGHRPGFWETIRFLRAAGPIYALRYVAIVIPRPSKLPGIGVVIPPIQSDGSTEGAWLYQPRPSAWVLGNHKTSQGCRPDLCSSVCRNRYPPPSKLPGIGVVIPPVQSDVVIPAQAIGLGFGKP